LLPVTLERLFLNASDAVNLFFILSGFLITSLLLAENERAGRVSVRNFYIRRALRIYPVYFVYLAVVALLVHPAYSPELFATLIFFLGNATFALFFPFPPFDHLWSIGIEEQFYLLAPVMARFRRSLPRILMAIVLVWWAVLIVVSRLPVGRLTVFVDLSRYDLIALGALLACAHHQKWHGLRWLRHVAVRVLAAAVIFWAIVFVPPTENIYYVTLLGLAFVALIDTVVVSPQLANALGHPALETLGNLSYSMYVIHPLFIMLFFTGFYPRLTPGVYPLVAYVTIIGGTLIVSALSYRFLETPFLRLRDRFR
jgi:peptidoglycan/LPS O-acetylase OafA/YrhL